MKDKNEEWVVAFFLSNIVLPTVGFLIIAYLITRRKSANPAKPKSTHTRLYFVGFVLFAFAAVKLIGNLSSSDGWGGNLLLILGFSAGAVSLYCLGGLIVSLMTPKE